MPITRVPATARCWRPRRRSPSWRSAMARISPARRKPCSYGETLNIGGVDVSFHPAGHVLGSAQILLAQGGSRTVVSGDYKRERDPTCEAFDPLVCDTFISEATFGLPVFRHAQCRTSRSTNCSPRKSFSRSARILSALMRLARRSASSRCLRAGRLRPPDLYPRRAGKNHRLLSGRRHHARRCAQGGRRGRVAGRDRSLPAERRQRSLEPEIRRTAAPPSPPAGCASAPMHASAASNCRSSFPIMPIGMASAQRSTKRDAARCSSRMARKTLWCIASVSAGLQAEPLHILGYGDEDAETAAESGA